jgi:uncharacterized membrane protein
MQSLRKYFATGLLVLVPLGITLWVLNILVSWMDNSLLLLPASMQAEFPFNVPWLGGVILSLLVVLTVGVLTANFVGRRLLLWWEALLRRIPVVNSIYSSVKQVSDTLFSPSGQAFRKAVLVQFPREGTWTVAFVVGTPGEAISRVIGSEAQTVYVPTAPNPTSGYIIMVAPSEWVELDISVEEALKFVVSMGVATPAIRPVVLRGPAAVAR